MFFKKYNWFFFKNFKQNKTIHYSLFFGIISVILIFVFIIITNSFFSKIIFFIFFFLLIIYWLASIFVYLIKKNQFNTYTRIIQRFWKRALSVFWLLELFLFLIFLFLILISPQESFYSLDNSKLVHNSFLSSKIFFINLMQPLLLILIYNFLLLNHKFNLKNVIINLFVLILLFNIFLKDFLDFYSISQHYSSFYWNHILLECNNDFIGNIKNDIQHSVIWEKEITEIKCRTSLHYLYILITFKAFHTFFIFFSFLFLQLNKLHLKYNSFDVISANLQNFYFIIFFSFILKIILIKTYINYIAEYIFYWFVITNNNYDFVYLYYILKAPLEIILF